MVRHGICPECQKGPRDIHHLHPETRQHICWSCYQKLRGKFGICPECQKGPRDIHRLHPETRQHICQNCYRKLRGKFGICSECQKGPRDIHRLHPETRQPICQSCYRKLRGKFGICSECQKGPRDIHYLHPETRQPICQSCYRKLRQKELAPVIELEPRSQPKIDLRQWFLSLTLREAANWILETALASLEKKPESTKAIEDLDRLVEDEPEKVKEILKEIYPYPAAIRIMNRFKETKEGEKLKDL